MGCFQIHQLKDKRKQGMTIKSNKKPEKINDDLFLFIIWLVVVVGRLFVIVFFIKQLSDLIDLLIKL